MQKFVSTLTFIILILLFNSVFISAQLKKIERDNHYCEADIYLSSQGTRYSDLITIKFNSEVITNSSKNVNFNALLTPKVVDYFSKLKSKFGDF